MPSAIQRTEDQPLNHLTTFGKRHTPITTLSFRGRSQWLFVLLAITTTSASANDLADEIRNLNPIILTPVADDPDHYRKLLPSKISAELKEANAKSTREWRAIKNLQEWQTFRTSKLDAMRQAIGYFPVPPKDLKAQTTRTHQGDGFKIECILFESRPRFLVTANLYVPDPLPASAPGIIIHPSHHNPKTQSELQDMGMTWARAGCYVLVMDQVGHGERAAHPFSTEQSYPKPFRLGRQDYWFRYNTGIQLHLIGDSLIAWQAYDLMRGVDLLLTRSQIDSNRILMMGSVASGGDPVAVTAALDERIAGAVIFNFGGPQPETRYPLPEDAQESFNYVGSGGWESTRNISFSARDGFLPWVIVGSIAPRKLIYAHEFAWDAERDPVWKRLQTIYQWHGQPDALAFAHGHGSVRESGDKASHCNNIGAVHRRHIHPSLSKWFGIPEPKEDYTKRRPAADLMAIPTLLKPERIANPLHEVASQAERSKTPMPQLKTEQEIFKWEQRQWSEILGDVAPPATVKVEARPTQTLPAGEITIHRVVIQVDGLPLPVLLLVPKTNAKTKPPVTVMVAQHGKAAFLKERSEEIAALLQAGVALCLPDVRGTGELRLDRDRGRTSWDTSVSSSALMLGTPMLGQRLRDLRAVLAWLRNRDEVDARRLAIWGDSLAPVNGPQVQLKVPQGVSDEPAICEPLGGLLALLVALFEEDVKTIFVQRGLFDLQGALNGGFFHIPHDVVVPAVVKSGPDGAVSREISTWELLALHGRSVRMSAVVNALNQPVDFRDFEVRTKSNFNLLAARVQTRIDFQLDKEQPKPADLAAWMAQRLKK